MTSNSVRPQPKKSVRGGFSSLNHLTLILSVMTCKFGQPTSNPGVRTRSASAQQTSNPIKHLPAGRAVTLRPVIGLHPASLGFFLGKLTAKSQCCTEAQALKADLKACFCTERFQTPNRPYSSCQQSNLSWLQGCLQCPAKHPASPAANTKLTKSRKGTPGTSWCE